MANDKDGAWMNHSVVDFCLVQQPIWDGERRINTRQQSNNNQTRPVRRPFYISAPLNQNRNPLPETYAAEWIVLGRESVLWGNVIAAAIVIGLLLERR